MKPLLVQVIVWVFVLAVAVVGHGFWYAAITDKSAEVAELQDQINTKMGTAGRIAAARTALSEIAGDEAAVRSYFVPETEVVSFIGNLEARAHAQTASMKVLSVSMNDNSSKQPSLILSLSIGGTFDAVMRTIGAIEYAPYDLSISRFSLVKEEKKVWNANLELIVGSVPTRVATSTDKSAGKAVSFYHP